MADVEHHEEEAAMSANEVTGAHVPHHVMLDEVVITISEEDTVDFLSCFFFLFLNLT